MHSSSLPSFLLKLKECHFSYHGQVQLLTPIFSPLLNILLLQLFCLSPTHHQISFSVYYSCQPTNIVFSTQNKSPLTSSTYHRTPLALSHKRHIHIHMYTHTLPISVSGIHPLTAQSQMEIIIDIVSLQISHISFVSWFLGSTCKAHLECVSFSPFILYHTIQATLISPNQTFCSYSSLLPPLALPPTCRVIFSEL